MSRQLSTSRLKAIIMGSVALMCAFLATAFWLTATSFGMERGDAVSQEQIQDPVLRRAGDVATLGFVILEIAATWAIMRIPLGANSSRIRRGLKAVAVLVALCFATYAITFAAVSGFAPDLLLDTSRTVQDLIMRMLG